MLLTDNRRYHRARRLSGHKLAAHGVGCTNYLPGTLGRLAVLHPESWTTHRVHGGIERDTDFVLIRSFVKRIVSVLPTDTRTHLPMVSSSYF